MMDTMFEIPSESLVKKCTITKEAVEGTGKPILEYADKEDETKLNTVKSVRIKSNGDEIA